jgi:trimethylamine--corrinoid protein Co-methyltransferase
MARYYGLPCYSTAGVADTDKPGIQATAEKLLTLIDVPKSGAQYIHYAFGLLERTNTFCPEQAVMDDAHIGIVKELLRGSNINEGRREATISMIREVARTSHGTYIYHLPLPSLEPVYVKYPLEDDEGGALLAAHKKYREIMTLPRKTLPTGVQREIITRISGVLPTALAEE